MHQRDSRSSPSVSSRAKSIDEVRGASCDEPRAPAPSNNSEPNSRLRVQNARQTFDLAQARYDGGAVDFVAVLDSQRSYLQARSDLTASEGRLLIQFVAINRALGNAPKLPRN